MEWATTTYRSTIGYFGFFEYPLGLDIYGIHKKLFVLGILGILVHTILTALWGIGVWLNREKGMSCGRKIPQRACSDQRV